MNTFKTEISVGGGLVVDDNIIKAGGNESWRNNELYFAARTDGNPGRGTFLDPYDASTADKIDAILSYLSERKVKANFHWAAGIYFINPVDPFAVFPFTQLSPTWSFRDGWHWIGAGKGRTIFKPSNNDDKVGIIIRWSFRKGDDEFIHCGSIKNCTFDGNINLDFIKGDGLARRYMSAIDLEVNDFILENVDFVRFGGRGQEMFPIILSNGILAEKERSCNIIIQNCSSCEIYNAGNGAGILIFSNKPSNKQRCIIQNNHFTDIYLSTANFANVDILYNYIFNGRADYSNINCDTGKNYNYRIHGNILVDAGNQHGIPVGSITVGTIEGDSNSVQFDNFSIKDNLFIPRVSYINAGVRLAGACKNFNISDNFIQIDHKNTKGLIRDDQDGKSTFFVGWHAPNLKNEGIHISNNRNIKDGSIPLGLENTLSPEKAKYEIGDTWPDFKNDDGFYYNKTTDQLRLYTNTPSGLFFEEIGKKKEPDLVAWTNSKAYSINSMTYDKNNLMSSGKITWPDGTPGIYSASLKNLGLNSSYAYNITYLGNQTGKISQRNMTINSSGNITASQPLRVTWQ